MSRVLRDVLVVVGAFLVAAVVVGLVWPLVVDPVVVERGELGVVTGELELGDRFGVEGWYALLGGGVGLLLGAVLVARHQTHEVATVLSVLAGAFLAAWLSAWVGAWVGPDDPNRVLADAELGATAEEQVVLTSGVVYLVWPISALIGCVVVLWSRPGRRERTDPAQVDAAQPDGRP